MINKKKICIIGSGLSGTSLAFDLAKDNRIEIILIDIDDFSKKFSTGHH